MGYNRRAKLFCLDIPNPPFSPFMFLALHILLAWLSLLKKKTINAFLLLRLGACSGLWVPPNSWMVEIPLSPDIFSVPIHFLHNIFNLYHLLALSLPLSWYFLELFHISKHPLLYNILNFHGTFLVWDQHFTEPWVTNQDPISYCANGFFSLLSTSFSVKPNPLFVSGFSACRWTQGGTARTHRNDNSNLSLLSAAAHLNSITVCIH